MYVKRESGAHDHLLMDARLTAVCESWTGRNLKSVKMCCRWVTKIMLRKRLNTKTDFGENMKPVRQGA